LPKVLIVEDELDIADSYKHLLQGEGEFDVVQSLSGFKAKYTDDHAMPDVAIVDLRLLDGSFLTLSDDPVWRERLRSWTIIFVSMEDDVSTIETLLSGPRRDYLTKPCNPNLLLAKCRALMRTASGTDAWPELDPQTLRARYKGKASEPLTALEYKIFHALCEQKAGVSSEAIASRVWDQPVPDNKLHVHLHRLRKKVEPLGLSIQFTGDVFMVSPMHA